MLAQTHLEVSREFIIHGREQLNLGNRLQASEKGWGAAAHAVKAVAERRGWQHRSHRDLFTVADRITEMTGRQEVTELFGVASALHQNFYEGWMNDGFISTSLNSVERLLDTLDAITTDWDR